MSTWADSLDSPDEFHGWETPEEKSDIIEDTSDQYHEALSNLETMATDEEKIDNAIQKAVAAQAEKTRETIISFRKEVVDPIQLEVVNGDHKIGNLANSMEQELRRARFADFALHHKINNMSKNLMILNVPPNSEEDPNVLYNHDLQYSIRRLNAIAANYPDQVKHVLSRFHIKKVFRLPLSKLSKRTLRGGYVPKYQGQDKIRVTFFCPSYRNLYMRCAEMENDKQFAIELTREECQFNDYLYEKKDQLNRDIDGEYWWFVRDFELKRGAKRQPGQRYDVEKNKPRRRQINENFVQEFGDGTVGYDFGLNIPRRQPQMEIDLIENNTSANGGSGSGHPGAGSGNGTPRPPPGGTEPSEDNNINGGASSTTEPTTSGTSASGTAATTNLTQMRSNHKVLGLRGFFERYQPSQGNHMYQSFAKTPQRIHSAYVSTSDELDDVEYVAKKPPAKRTRRSRRDSHVPKTTPVKRPPTNRLTSTPCGRAAVSVPIQRSMTLRSQSQNARDHQDLNKQVDNAIDKLYGKRKLQSSGEKSTSTNATSKNASSTASSLRVDDGGLDMDDEVFEESIGGELATENIDDQDGMIQELVDDLENTNINVDEDEKSAIADNPLDITEIAKRQPTVEIRGQADGADPDPEDVGVDFKLNICRSVIGNDRIEFPELYRQTLEKIQYIEDANIKSRPGLFKQAVHDCWLLHFLLAVCEESKQTLEEWKDQAKQVLNEVIKFSEDGMINTEMIKSSLIIERSQLIAKGQYVPKTFNTLAFGPSYIQKRNELLSMAKTQIEKDKVLRNLMIGMNQTITLDLDGSILEN